MQSATHTARKCGHLSRHEHQQRARAEAFSRRTPATVPAPLPVKLARDDLELIDRLVHQDRTAVSSAVLAIAGVGSSGPVHRAVLERVGAAARWAEAEGAITGQRGEQIARHVRRALERTTVPVAG